ncbi:MAG: Nramp family divalent metal transporter [Saprospiraceae bacterium]|nr:Nramp family divalent metal transporter [Saprospiraceae bacterium]
MDQSSPKPSIVKRILLAILAFGPGIFAIGYTIGTGSVTSMIVAGSKYGMQLLWVLLLSCFFSGILIYVYGKYALITGETALFSMKKNIKWGKFLALLILVGISFGQWNSLMGILGISSNIIYEIVVLNYPNISTIQYQFVLGTAIVILIIFYAFLLVGKYTFFEKVLIFFVSIMGLSFLLSLFFSHPLTTDVLKGMIPSIPNVEGGKMMVAAFVGTTMAAATFLSRPLFIEGKGWTLKDMKHQRNDAIVAAILVFVISGSIMAVAHGALYTEGKTVSQVLDMSNTLEPIAGKWAVTIFFFGTLSAGLSSIFPCMLIAPMLLADYQSGKLDTKSKQFRIITFIACIVALVVPVFGANPIEIQILSQVFNVFVLPAVIIGILILTSNKLLMQGHSFHPLVRMSLYAALLFSLVVSYNGVLGVIEYFQSL